MFVREYPLYATEYIRDLKELTDRSIRLYEKKEALDVTDSSECRLVAYGWFDDGLRAAGNALFGFWLSGAHIAAVCKNYPRRLLSFSAAVNSDYTEVYSGKEPEKEELFFSVKRSGACTFFFSDIDEAAYVITTKPRTLTVLFTIKDGRVKTIDEQVGGRSLCRGAGLDKRLPDDFHLRRKGGNYYIWKTFGF